MEIPKELVNAIADGDAVLFIGSELSVEAGLPDWDELLKPLASQIALPSRLQSSPLLIAQYYEEKVGRWELINHIVQQTDTTDIEPTTNHLRLTKLGIRTWVTTNYDNLLEKTLDKVGQQCRVVVRDQNLPYISKRFLTLVKLHGDRGQEDTIIISQHDYDTYNHRFPRVGQKISALVPENVFLFIGYNLADPDFTRLQSEIGIDSSGTEPRKNYAILIDDSGFNLGRLEASNTDIVCILSGGRESRSKQLGEFLDVLIAKIKDVRSKSLSEPSLTGGKVPDSERLLDRLQVQYNIVKTRLIGEMDLHKIDFDQYLVPDDPSYTNASSQQDLPLNKMSWHRFLSICTTDESNNHNNARHTLINCLPIKKWGEAIGLRIVDDLLNEQPPTPALFIQVQPQRNADDISALLETFEVAAAEIRSSLVLVVQFIGYRSSNVILALLDNMNATFQSSQKISLIIVGHTTPDDVATIHSKYPLSVFQVRPRRLRSGTQSTYVPIELKGVNYPMNVLLEYPECQIWYQKSENLAIEQHKYPSSQLPEHIRWEITFSAIRRFIYDNINVDPSKDQLQTLRRLSKAWVSRFLPYAEPRRKKYLHELFASGLFIPDTTETESFSASAVSDAVSAYVDAFFLIGSKENDVRHLLLQKLLETASSPRRLSPERRLDPSATRSRMALMMSAYLGNNDFFDWLINSVAPDNVWLAFDLYAMRRAEQSKQPNLIQRILNHAHEHGSTMPVMFGYSFDRIEPLYNSDRGVNVPDFLGAKRILEEVSDPDLLATLLISCAIPQNSHILDLELWDAVVPSNITRLLRSLGDKLKAEALLLSSGVLISKRVLLLEHLRQIFPNFDRGHSPDARIAQLPWLTAYILAFGCGGRLPHWKEELSTAYENKEFREFALDSVEMPIRDLTPLYRIEWLESEAGEGVTGNEFRFKPSNPIPFYQRLVPRASVHRSVTHNTNAFSVIPDKEENVTAKPSRNYLAACRVVFDTHRKE